MFKFGNRKPSIKHYAIVGIVLTTIIGTLSQCTGISTNRLWDLLDEIQRKYFPNGIINEFVLKDDEKLNRRIQRDIDKAIEEYRLVTGDNGIVTIRKPVYLEKPVDNSVCYTKECQSLGGEMRLCAPWMPDCPEGLPRTEE